MNLVDENFKCKNIHNKNYSKCSECKNELIQDDTGFICITCGCLTSNLIYEKHTKKKIYQVRISKISRRNI